MAHDLVENKINVHNMVLHTKVLGPYERCALWLQGCHRTCKGCMSDEARDLHGGKLVLIDDVYTSIASLSDIEGLTVSGGEPFLQIDALHELLQKLRKNTSLGVILYTGYYLNELEALHNAKVDEILTDFLDIIIDGPYIDELNDGKSLRGSENQTVHFLTDRYRGAAYLYDSSIRNTELRVTDKEMFFIGVPDRKTLASWKTIVGKE
jgi:anaerobic ribonucleoside-triphosphate reductase activating protein